MAVLQEPRTRSTLWTARRSLVVEWAWALVRDCDERKDDFPVRTGRFAAAPGLAERIAAFWEDDYGEFTELVLLAHRGGFLWDDNAERILARLRQAATRPIGDEPLDSEKPEHRLAVLDRLERLRGEPETREAWLRLVADVAAALAPSWDREGIAFVDEAVQSFQRQAERATDWTDFKRLGSEGCWDHEKLPEMCARTVTAGGEVVIVPSWVGGKALLLSFGDLVVVSRHPSSEVPPSDATREAAKRLRALADPTRLGMVEELTRRPRSVGELARDFRLSQPTISNHVRVLREAGLVGDGTEGRARRLTVDGVAGLHLLDQVRARLPGDAGPGADLASRWRRGPGSG